jgi:phosphoribosylformimino-5-aminoimidazole carboxamide ribotide isomerase
VKLFPAIDILGGNAVRLAKGRFDASKVYDEDPVAVARRFSEAGARHLHVVDLDGAREGRPVNLGLLAGISTQLGAKGLQVPVQYGGGLRSLEAVGEALRAGAARVILGTAALTNPTLLERALRRHGAERVMVSVDVRGGEAVRDGWTQAADVDVRAAIERLIDAGVRALAYTNVDRDGMLEGPDLENLAWVADAAGAVGSPAGASPRHPPVHLLYSGGIGDLADLEHLAELRAERHLDTLDGVIVGKALYEGRFTIEEAHRALGGAPPG